MQYAWVAFAFWGLVCLILNEFSLFQDNLDSLSWLIVASISLIILFGLIKKYKSNYWILIIAYTFRIFLLFWDRCCSHIFLLPNSGLDSEKFHAYALEISKNANSTKKGIYFYSDTLSVLYRIFGNQRIIGQFFNIMLSISAISILYYILKKINIENKYIRVALIFVSFSPNYSIMSSILLRESIVTFLITASLMFFVLWFFDNKTYMMILAIVIGIIASLFHTGAVSAAIGYAIIWVLYDKQTSKFNLSLKSIIALFFIFSIVYVINKINEDYFTTGIFGKSALESVAAHENENGGSTYIVGFNIDNEILNYIINTPIRVLYFILSPMPWDWRGINDIFAFVFSSVFYMFGIILCCKAIRKNLKKKNFEKSSSLLIALLIILSISYIIFSWGVTNSGTAMRHRDKFISVYVLMTVISIYELQKNKQIDSANKERYLE